MATHSSTLAWEIPWTEESCRLQSMGLQSRTRLKRLSSSRDVFLFILSQALSSMCLSKFSYNLQKHI